MNKNIKIFGAVLAIAASVSVAQAGTITYVSSSNFGGLSGANVKEGITGQTDPNEQTNWGKDADPSNHDHDIHIRQFNAGADGIPVGAILDSATISYYGKTDIYYGAENLANETSTLDSLDISVLLHFVPTAEGTFELKVGFSAPPVPAGVSVTFPLNLSTYDGNYDDSGSSGWNLGIAYGTPGDSVSYHSSLLNQAVAMANLSAYVGTGEVDVWVGAASWIDSKFSGGDLRETTDWLAGADASITYTYHVATTPEPATLALLGLGLAGLGAARCRRSF